MAQRADRRPIPIRHRRRSIDVLWVLFLLVVFYLAIQLFLYFTTKRTAVFRVSPPAEYSLRQNWKGIILRKEELINAPADGYVNFYLTEGKRIEKGGLVASLDKNGDLISRLANDENAISKLPGPRIEDLKSKMVQFSTNFNRNHFYEIYDAKARIETTLIDSLSMEELKSAKDRLSESFTKLYTQGSGMIVFRKDGLEGTTFDNLDPDVFNKPVRSVFVRPGEDLKAGDFMYKRIDSDDFTLAVMISRAEETQLLTRKAKLKANQTFTVKVYIPEVHLTAVVPVSIEKKGDASFALLHFNKFGSNFTDQRFLTVNFIWDDLTGYKIPKSSLLNKSLVAVPKEYVTRGTEDNQDRPGVILISKNKEGKETGTFTPFAIYAEDEKNYYTEAGVLDIGSILQKPDSSERFGIQDAKTQDGVWSLNRGYAVFRPVKVLSEVPGGEFVIVSDRLKRTIDAYDYIALDASRMKEGQIVN